MTPRSIRGPYWTRVLGKNKSGILKEGKFKALQKIMFKKNKLGGEGRREAEGEIEEWKVKGE